MAEYWALLDQEAQKQCYTENKIEFAKGQKGVTRYPVTCVPAGSIIPDGMEIGHRFEALTPEEARTYYQGLLDRGIPQNRNVVGNTGSTASPATVWRHRGFPHYLLNRLKEFGLEQKVLMKEIQDHPPLRRISSTLGDLTAQYHRARKVDGVAQLAPSERHQASVALEHIERYCVHLGLQAAASTAMLDEAYRALGIEHIRPFSIIATPSPEPTTVLTTDDAVAANTSADGAWNARSTQEATNPIKRTQKAVATR